MSRKKRLTEGELIASFEKVIEARGKRAPGLVTGVGDDATGPRQKPSLAFKTATDSNDIGDSHIRAVWTANRNRYLANTILRVSSSPFARNR